MNGQEVLDALMRLTPAQLQLPFVVGHEEWHYDTTVVELIECHDGVENDEPDNVPNVITIRSAT